MSETSKSIPSVLADLAGADRTLPYDRPDPEREWVIPGHDQARTVVMRAVGVERVGEGDLRTKYTLYTGYGYHTDAFHCYPKDQWTEAEAVAHAAKAGA